MRLPNTDIHIAFYSASGQKILDFCDIRSNLTLDLSSLREGVYYIAYGSEDFVKTKRIFKI